MGRGHMGVNLLSAQEGDLTREVFLPLLERPGVRIEKIVSRGQSSPADFWYDQDEDEWVAVLDGEAVLEFDSGARQTLRAGDHLFLPANRKHRVAHTTDPTVWLAIFLPPTPQSPDQLEGRE